MLNALIKFISHAKGTTNKVRLELNLPNEAAENCRLIANISVSFYQSICLYSRIELYFVFGYDKMYIVLCWALLYVSMSTIALQISSLRSNEPSP